MGNFAAGGEGYQGVKTALDFDFHSAPLGSGFQDNPVDQFAQGTHCLIARFGIVDGGAQIGHLFAMANFTTQSSLGLRLRSGLRGAQSYWKEFFVKDEAYYMSVIDEIENVRTKNNKNWMDLLRLAFRHAPKEAAEIVSEIYREDEAVSGLAKKLTQIDDFDDAVVACEPSGGF